jgi:hypothetical protein
LSLLLLQAFHLAALVLKLLGAHRALLLPLAPLHVGELPLGIGVLLRSLVGRLLSRSLVLLCRLPLLPLVRFVGGHLLVALFHALFAYLSQIASAISDHDEVKPQARST